jgi:hypothetical protein
MALVTTAPPVRLAAGERSAHDLGPPDGSDKEPQSPAHVTEEPVLRTTSPPTVAAVAKIRTSFGDLRTERS